MRILIILFTAVFVSAVPAFSQEIFAFYVKGKEYTFKLPIGFCVVKNGEWYETKRQQISVQKNRVLGIFKDCGVSSPMADWGYVTESSEYILEKSSQKNINKEFISRLTDKSNLDRMNEFLHQSLPAMVAPDEVSVATSNSRIVGFSMLFPGANDFMVTAATSASILRDNSLLHFYLYDHAELTSKSADAVRSVQDEFLANISSISANNPQASLCNADKNNVEFITIEKKVLGQQGWKDHIELHQIMSDSVSIVSGYDLNKIGEFEQSYVTRYVNGILATGITPYPVDVKFSEFLDLSDTVFDDIKYDSVYGNVTLPAVGEEITVKSLYPFETEYSAETLASKNNSTVTVGDCEYQGTVYDYIDPETNSSDLWGYIFLPKLGISLEHHPNVRYLSIGFK